MNRSMEDPLTKRLVQEAQSNRPEFSPSMHEKICQDVRRVGLASESVIFTIRPWWQRPAAAAAILALMGWGAYQYMGRSVTDPPANIAKQPAPVPERVATLPEPDSPPVETLVSDEELGEEVAVVAATLLDQMPVNLLNVVGDLAQTQ